MTDLPDGPMRNDWPLDKTPDEAVPTTTACDTAGEAGVVGAPPHDFDFALVATAGERQQVYEACRRAHAQAIGRPHPVERHPVWPR